MTPLKQQISLIPFSIEHWYSPYKRRRLLADKFLHVTVVPANAYQRTKFQLSSSISFGDMRGVPK